MRRLPPFEDRLEVDTIPEPNTGCLLWLGPIDKNGYGRLSTRHDYGLAHRAAWSLAHGGATPEGSVLHKCDQPCCVNPAHLYVGTQTDNIRDAVRRGRNYQAKKTHCKRGHPLSGDNLYSYTNDGHIARCCRECHRLRCTAWMARKAHNKAVRAIAISKKAV